MKNAICKLCKGKCCLAPYVSKRELLAIEKEIGKKLKVVKENNLYQWVNPSKKCQFNDNGCILKYKPIACEIYPFLPTERGWILRTRCPFWHKFTKENLRDVKIQFLKRKSDFKAKYKEIKRL